MLKEADSLAEQNRHQVNVNLVEQTQLQALAHDAAGSDDDVLVPGDGFCLSHRGFDALRHEGEGRAGYDPFLGDTVGQHHHRNIHRVFTVPGPGDIEQTPPGDERPGSAGGFLDHLGALR